MATLQVTIWYHPLSWWIYEYWPVTWWTSYTVRQSLSQTSLSLDNCYSTSKGWAELDLDAIRSDIFGWNDEVDLYQISCPMPLYSHGHIDTLHMRRVQKTITDYSAMRGPCPEGYHVPMMSEWNWLKTIMTWLSLTTWGDWKTKLHIPFAGLRWYDTAWASKQGTEGYYWSSSAYSDGGSYNLYVVNLDSSTIHTDLNWWRASGCFIRPFKDEFVVPTSSWTVIQWAIWSAWIFRNQTNWLISITSDWSTWYTIADKNLWATTTYSDWDTLTESNMWNHYQWWNNYWFPPTWSISKISTTQVNTSWYWPGNYYESDTFIKGSKNRSSVDNRDLRWWVTWPQTVTVDRREPVYYGPQPTLWTESEILSATDIDTLIAELNSNPQEYYNMLLDGENCRLGDACWFGDMFIMTKPARNYYRICGKVVLYTSSWVWEYWNSGCPL